MVGRQAKHKTGAMALELADEPSTEWGWHGHFSKARGAAAGRHPPAAGDDHRRPAKPHPRDRSLRASTADGARPGVRRRPSPELLAQIAHSVPEAGAPQHPKQAPQRRAWSNTTRGVCKDRPDDGHAVRNLTNNSAPEPLPRRHTSNIRTVSRTIAARFLVAGTGGACSGLGHVVLAQRTHGEPVGMQALHQWAQRA